MANGLLLFVVWLEAKEESTLTRVRTRPFSGRESWDEVDPAKYGRDVVLVAAMDALAAATKAQVYFRALPVGRLVWPRLTDKRGKVLEVSAKDRVAPEVLS